MGFACISGLTGVVFGAFGAHALKSRLSSDALHAWETAVQYQLIHSVMILVVTLFLFQWQDNAWLRWSGISFATGIVLFSGSLYLLTLTTGFRWLGPVTPLGGLALMAGWGLMLVAIVTQK